MKAREQAVVLREGERNTEMAYYRQRVLSSSVIAFGAIAT